MTRARVFRDRREAGAALAAVLLPLAGERPVVLALPRGGVPVAFEIARALEAPLDVLPTRKIGAPGNRELGLGAIAEGGGGVLDRQTIDALGIGDAQLERCVERARAQLARQVGVLRGDHEPVAVADRTVIVADDGLATGGTAAAALGAVRERGARRIVLAVPVGSPQAVARLRPAADAVVCLEVPEELRAVGAWYRDFGQVTDAEVAALLQRAAALADGAASRTVEIPAGDGVVLAGDLERPAGAGALVVFAHGSGSSRRSPRNRAVAAQLRDAGLATLLIDLLTSAEADDRRNVFDIDLLGRRLRAATAWAAAEPDLATLPLGLFGASTGAAAALVAAADDPRVGAVVSRGGRPDLAASAFGRVRAPVLLIVGGDDTAVLQLNRGALEALGGSARLEVVPGATHLFEEPGALEAVARMAAAWFAEHLAGGDG